jgi:hypothetical protein
MASPAVAVEREILGREREEAVMPPAEGDCCMARRDCWAVCCVWSRDLGEEEKNWERRLPLVVDDRRSVTRSNGDMLE